MVEAVDKVTQYMEKHFRARDIQESVSLLCLEKISTQIIGKILTNMMESGYIKRVERTKDGVNTYNRVKHQTYPAMRKGVK